MAHDPVKVFVQIRGIRRRLSQSTTPFITQVVYIEQVCMCVYLISIYLLSVGVWFRFPWVKSFAVSIELFLFVSHGGGSVPARSSFSGGISNNRGKRKQGHA